MRNDIILKKKLEEELPAYKTKINHTAFMLESNRIEGEDRVNPNDLEAIAYAVETKLKTLDAIIIVHKRLGSYLDKSWVGKLRTVNVTVGGRTCPDFRNVPRMMEAFVEWQKKANAWQAHNTFELIHPFQDLNGRVGRLIWLVKALDEGYKFGIPFLQAYYYRTLSNAEFDNRFLMMYAKQK